MVHSVPFFPELARFFPWRPDPGRCLPAAAGSERLSRGAASIDRIGSDFDANSSRRAAPPRLKIRYEGAQKSPDTWLPKENPKVEDSL
jgi:hypothetical protein